MPLPGATRKEIDDLMKYDGVYHKVDTTDLEADCFCSLAICDQDFILGEVVIETWGNLFHIKCFGKGHNIKKPSFVDDDYT